MIGRDETGATAIHAGNSPHSWRTLGHPGAMLVGGSAGLLAVATASALAADPLAVGNRHFRAGDMEGALAAYDAPAHDPSDPRLRLARATAIIASAKSGDAAAASALQRAEDELRALVASTSSDTDLLRTANANLGALLLNRAEAAAAADRPMAVDLFRQAASSYLAASRLETTDLEAARNVEHARRRAAEILEQLQQSPPTPQERQSQQQRNQQQGRDQQEGQEAAEQSDQRHADQQHQDAQNLAAHLDDLASQQQQESQQTAADRQEADAAEQQRSISDQTQRQLGELERQLESLDQSGQHSGSPGEQETPAPDEQQSSMSAALDQARQMLEEAREAQERAERALRQGDPQDEAAQAQQQAADRLARAAQQARQAAERAQRQSEQPGQPSDADDPQSPTPPRTAQEARTGRAGDPLVQQLLDRERRQREQRAVSRPGRPVRVERDW